MTPYQALLAERQRIDADLATMRPAAVAEVRALMGTFGVTVADLGGASAGKPKPGRPPVPTKYRDAAGNTWSGRGIKPVWLSTAIAQGATIEQFAV